MNKDVKKRFSMTAAILAGGENRRFHGKVKANLEIEGKSILGHILEIIEPLFNETIIIANDQDAFRSYEGFRIIPDHFKKTGPLGGIHAALKNSVDDAVFILASDMPLLSPGLVTKQVELYEASDAEVLIPSADNFDEPLHAIYSTKIIDRLEKFLSTSGKLAIKDFLILTEVDYFNPLEMGFTKEIFANINTPGDLDSLQKGSYEKKSQAG